MREDEQQAWVHVSSTSSLMLSSRFNMRHVGSLVLLCTLMSAAASAQHPPTLTPELVRSRVEREWRVKARKMRELLQPVMRRHGIDLWVIKPGRIGHEMKTAAEKKTVAAGLDVNVYSHVQGYWVHDAGVWLNPDWPERYGAHPRSKLLGGEWMSLEFASSTVVPEWGGQRVRIMREEDLHVRKDGSQEFLSGPQNELWIVR